MVVVAAARVVVAEAAVRAEPRAPLRYRRCGSGGGGASSGDLEPRSPGGAAGVWSRWPEDAGVGTGGV